MFVLYGLYEYELLNHTVINVVERTWSADEIMYRCLVEGVCVEGLDNKGLENTVWGAEGLGMRVEGLGNHVSLPSRRGWR